MKAITKFKSLLTPKGEVAKPYIPKPRNAVGAGKGEEQETGDEREPAGSRPLPSGKEAASGGVTDEDRAKNGAAEHAAHIIRERERFLKASSTAAVKTPAGRQESLGEKGHAHDVTDVEAPFLGIGTGDPLAADVLSDSPTAVHFNVYDMAFEEEVDKIKRSTSRKGRRGATLYLTKHLRDEEKFKTMEDPEIHWVGEDDEDDDAGGGGGTGKSGVAGESKFSAPSSGPSFADLVAGAVQGANSKAQEVARVGQGSSKPDSKVAEL